MSNVPVPPAPPVFAPRATVPEPWSQLWRSPELRRRFSAAPTAGALLADASAVARDALNFDRAVILGVDSGVITARASDALANEASDRLRRRVLSDPLLLRTDSYEADLIRQGRVHPSRRQSQLATTLELTNFAITPIAPESRTLAVLVLDRDSEPVTDTDVLLAILFSELVATGLERIVVRARQEQLASDIQHLTASAHALMREVLGAPTSLPTTNSQWPAFPLTELFAAPAESQLRDLLSASEAKVAALLAQGRSNREIADEVILSPETVKATVARILRKLGVNNRVEAATVIARLGG